VVTVKLSTARFIDPPKCYPRFINFDEIQNILGWERFPLLNKLVNLRGDNLAETGNCCYDVYAGYEKILHIIVISITTNNKK
jgi:hypothetical protein